MKMKKVGFSRFERLLNVFGLYDLYNKLVDSKVVKQNQSSDLYKFSTASHLLKYFDGYMGHGAITKSSNLGFGFIHASFINTLKPERVLCIGSRKGFIPAICALACKYNMKGQVDFVDAGKDKNDDGNWGGIGFWKKNNPNQHFSIFEINKYLTTYIMTSQQFANKYKKRKYEYIYIDGNHSYEGVKLDYNLFWTRLSSGGIMVFHDISAKGIHHDNEFGVWKFWKELKSKKKIEFIDGVNAIGIIQK